jgi:hypothetical protein
MSDATDAAPQHDACAQTIKAKMTTEFVLIAREALYVDDVNELVRLRAENEKLREQLAVAQLSTVSASPTSGRHSSLRKWLAS